MDRGMGISTYTFLSWIGAVAVYIGFTGVLIYQWLHPERALYSRRPRQDAPWGKARSDQPSWLVRLWAVGGVVILNFIAVEWLIEQSKTRQ